METTIVEQRRDVRSDLVWPVSVWIPDANRFFSGKSVNVSKGGVYLKLPMTAPVCVGQEVELNFPRTAALAHQKGQYARIKTGRIVRVERSEMLRSGTIGVAVQFCAI